MDVCEDCGWQERRFSGGVLMDLAAESGGADVVVEAGEDVEVGFGSGCIAETVVNEPADWLRLGVLSLLDESD